MTLTVKVPRVVLNVVLTFKVAVPGAVTGLPIQVAVAFAGSPDAFKLTEPAKPPTDATLTVYVAVCPRVTVTDDGLTATPKSGLLTTSVTATE
ncbi:MAG TPA: hypothetical protein VFI00_04595 [Kribbella sp.]|nr:hypothetical protein [Kribbella sp.]